MTEPISNPVDEAIVRFIRRHHIMTLATLGEQAVWCSNLFYAYDRERNLLLFSSDADTRHTREMEAEPRVAASIVLETRMVGKLQGLQIEGIVQHGDEQARRLYLKRFPFAAVMELNIWQLRPTTLKLTDNTLGFGKKLQWRQS